ncbi:hypothetical protein [Arthrobacter sp. ISL-95]|uniref:hypothetical protein n=1 Tax=Arthrobacter sp. ISL-95 TaxID=2819116 RepID=UPI001BEA11DE|nr:hypothetical protein [Arthrobacter sp. ISL-95]MBT2588546.1 hypothetical protein [Arthrobacter sp. ISL-95]
MSTTSETVHVNVDEQYPVFSFVDKPENYPAAVTIEVDPGTLQRWQEVIDAYEGVREEIAAKLAVITGTTYPDFE